MSFCLCWWELKNGQFCSFREDDKYTVIQKGRVGSTTLLLRCYVAMTLSMNFCCYLGWVKCLDWSSWSKLGGKGRILNVQKNFFSHFHILWMTWTQEPWYLRLQVPWNFETVYAFCFCYMKTSKENKLFAKAHLFWHPTKVFFDYPADISTPKF